MIPVITLDGPSGSGKGTIAARLASQYGYHLLDSGALYRLLGLYAGSRGWLDQPCEFQLAEAARQLDIQFRTDDQQQLHIWLEGQEVTDDIRTEQVGAWASMVAAFPAVRDSLMAWQRDCAQSPGLVADGRDMGTVVFPDAPVKIYLTASAEARAMRRFLQLKGMGIDVNLDDILADLQARDHRDMSRAVAPLRPAEDALLIDSSTMDIATVLDTIRQYIVQKLPALA